VSCVGDAETNSKHVIGMAFYYLQDVENFYRDYAHDAGFSICIGQQKKEIDEIVAIFIVQGKALGRRMVHKWMINL
jgi:hypothetical protein